MPAIISTKDSWLHHIRKLVKSTKYRKECSSTAITNMNILRDSVLNLKIKSYGHYADQSNSNLDGIWSGKRYEIPNKNFIENATGAQFHDGILAEVATPSLRNASSNSLRNLERAVIFPKVSDPANLGLVTRCAMSLRASQLVIGEESVDPFNFKAVAASKGLILKEGFISKFLSTDLFTISKPTVIAELKSKIPSDFVLRRKFGFVDIYSKSDARPSNLENVNIVMGSESHGFENLELENLSSNFYYATIESGISSMNVATATSVIMASLWTRDPGTL